MDHYLDIDLLPDPEFPQHFLMNALYAKLHRALVALQRDDIGVSFPCHTLQPVSLGSRLRVHGGRTALEQLVASDWLKGMKDHVSLRGPSVTPEATQFRPVTRVQAKSNPERLRRRLMRRHAISDTEAIERIPDSLAETLKLPYVQLSSASTGQSFRLFIEHGPVVSKPTPGRFNAYGLSLHATVPWF